MIATIWRTYDKWNAELVRDLRPVGRGVSNGYRGISGWAITVFFSRLPRGELEKRAESVIKVVMSGCCKLITAILAPRAVIGLPASELVPCNASAFLYWANLEVHPSTWQTWRSAAT